MSTSTDADIDLGTLIDFDAPLKCGHRDHDNMPDIHGGKVKWRFKNTCHGCGDSRSTILCDKWVLLVARNVDHLMCRNCLTFSDHFIITPL